MRKDTLTRVTNLNEVLSIRAQECEMYCETCPSFSDLNEVLSIRAQEFQPLRQVEGSTTTSMKS